MHNHVYLLKVRSLIESRRRKLRPTIEGMSFWRSGSDSAAFWTISDRIQHSPVKSEPEIHVASGPSSRGRFEPGEPWQELRGRVEPKGGYADDGEQQCVSPEPPILEVTL